MSLYNGYSGLWSGYSGLGSTSGLYSGASGLAGGNTSLTVPAGALAVYASRRLVSDYAGALFQLRRISDSVTLDIYASSSANPAPDVSGVAAFLGVATQCYVTKIYDQLGSGNDVVQATVANMPYFSLTNAVNGKYSITFDGNQHTAGFMTIPAAITGDGRSVTVGVTAFVESCAVPWVGMVGALWNTAGALSFALGEQTNRLQVLTSSTFKKPTSGNYRCRSQVQTTVFTSSATDIVAYQDGNTASLGVNNAGTWVGGKVGGGANTQYFYGEWYAMVIYPTAFSSTNAALLKTVLDSHFTPITTYDTLFLMTGNSIVQGTKATLLMNNPRQAEPLLTRQIAIADCGVFGQTAATVHTNLATYYSTAFNATLVKNIAIIIEPTNDINAAASGNIAAPSTAAGGGGGSVGTNAWNNYTLPDIIALEAAGFTVLVPTILNRSWSGSAGDITDKTAAQLDWNTLARASGRTVVDYQALPNMANPANATYFSDGVHPTTAGYLEMATLLASVLNGII